MQVPCLSLKIALHFKMDAFMSTYTVNISFVLFGDLLQRSDNEPGSVQESTPRNGFQMDFTLFRPKRLFS